MTYLSRCAFLIILVSPFGVANTLLDELSICAKNNDSSQRLVCYDTLAKKTISSQPKQLKLPQQIPSQAVTHEPVDNAIQAAHGIQPEPVLAQSELPKVALIAQPQKTVDIADKANQQQAKFGHENKQRAEDLIKQIRATTIKVNKAPYGQLIITIDNGQIWRQTDSSRFKLRKDDVVIIKRGALGSFFIGKENSKKRIRAKRVK